MSYPSPRNQPTVHLPDFIYCSYSFCAPSAHPYVNPLPSAMFQIHLAERLVLSKRRALRFCLETFVHRLQLFTVPPTWGIKMSLASSRSSDLASLWHSQCAFASSTTSRSFISLRCAENFDVDVAEIFPSKRLKNVNSEQTLLSLLKMTLSVLFTFNNGQYVLLYWCIPWNNISFSNSTLYWDISLKYC